jgi:hypothetical protein
VKAAVRNGSKEGCYLGLKGLHADLQRRGGLGGGAGSCDGLLVLAPKLGQALARTHTVHLQRQRLGEL